MPLGPPEDPDRFEDFDACVSALSEDMSEEEARRVCGAWENRSKAGKSLRDDGTLERRVEFKATDSDRRIAVGGVMVPDKVDLQGDFIRQDLIEQFSDTFMELLQDGDGTPGVMHSVFPTSHVTLVENRVLDEPREIGGKEFPEGSWIQGWKFTDDELWSLVEDGVLSAYSIGARNVEWSEPMEELPDDVERATDYPDDEPIWEITSGEVHEVSSVDIPAVPDAVMVTAKNDAKAILDHVEGKEQFLDVMSERGANQDDAERLWHYLQRAIDEHGEGKSASFFRRLGKGAWEALTGDVSQTKQKPDDKQFMGEPVDELSEDVESALEGLMDVAFDAIESEVSEDHPQEVAEAVAGVAGSVVTERLDEIVEEITQELRDSEQSLQMTDDDNPDDNPPEWAKSLQETAEENSKAIDELREKFEGNKSDDPWEDAPEWAKSLKESTEANAESIEELADASGKSQQLDGDGEEETRSKADILGIPGGDD